MIRPRARREHRQVEEVAAVDRQLRQLTRIDVAAQLGRAHVHERRFTGDGHRLGDRRRHHHEVERDLLADEHFDAHLLKRGEARQLGGDEIDADADGDAERAAVVGERLELRAGGFVHGTHGDAGQHSGGGVFHGSGDGGFLREADGGKQ